MNMISKQRFEDILKQFNSIGPILVVGDVGVDKYTYGEVKRISPEAPVPIVQVKKEWQKLGLAANVSDNLKELDVSSTLCGVIGDDTNANLFEHLLEDHGLKTWGVVRDSSRSTILKERITTKMQQVCRVDYEPEGEISEENIERIVKRSREFEEGHSSLIIQDYGKGTVNKKLCEQLIAMFKASNKLVCVDPSRFCHPQNYKGAHLLKPNLAECTVMVESLGYRKEKLEKMAHILLDKLQLEKVVVTLGADGMALLDSRDDGGLKVIPTVATEVFDVSGAGDTVISVLMASLQSEASLEEAAWISNCAAGVVVAKRGTANVNRSELVSFYSKLERQLKV